MDKKFVAYIGSYTNYGKSKGIAMFDVDAEKGILTKKGDIEVHNCSAICASRDGKFVYAVVDEGVAAFAVEKDGNLRPLNTGSIRGMRGCSIDVDSKNRFLIVAGYHDSKLTVVKIEDDGSVGPVTDSYFEQGYGSVVEGNFNPHITCVKFSPDENYVCAVVQALDHIKIFRLDPQDGTLSFADVVRCELDSHPRKMEFSPDGRHLYIMSEKKSYIAVYDYADGGQRPVIGFKQLVSTQPKKGSSFSVACALEIPPSGRYVIAANAGANTIALFDRNDENGLLYQRFVLLVSGDFPKRVVMLPGEQYLLSLNHVSNSVTCFHVMEDKKYMVMNGRSIDVDYPNCCAVVEI